MPMGTTMPFQSRRLSRRSKNTAATEKGSEARGAEETTTKDTISMQKMGVEQMLQGFLSRRQIAPRATQAGRIRTGPTETERG